MLTIGLGVLGVVFGLIIYYVRLISVLVDEKKNIADDPQQAGRHKWLYWLSEKMELVWPLVRSIDAKNWASTLANVCCLLVLILLVSMGLFQAFVVEYAGFFLFAIFVSMSISNGPKSLETYKKLKPYLPVMFPAVMYQSMCAVEIENPALAHNLIIPGYGFFETKLLAALTGFVMVFVIPYPMAKFDSWFSSFIARSTLFFAQDFMRLGVLPQNDNEISLRKVAKESIVIALRFIGVIIGIVTYLIATS